MHYRETSMCISWIILYYFDILIFYITVILYLIAGGNKCCLYRPFLPFCSWRLYFVLLSLLCFDV